MYKYLYAYFIFVVYLRIEALQHIKLLTWEVGLIHCTFPVSTTHFRWFITRTRIVAFIWIDMITSWSLISTETFNTVKIQHVIINLNLNYWCFLMWSKIKTLVSIKKKSFVSLKSNIYLIFHTHTHLSLIHISLYTPQDLPLHTPCINPYELGDTSVRYAG